MSGFYWLNYICRQIDSEYITTLKLNYNINRIRFKGESLSPELRASTMHNPFLSVIYMPRMKKLSWSRRQVLSSNASAIYHFQ